eukprot:292372_1
MIFRNLGIDDNSSSSSSVGSDSDSDGSSSDTDHGCEEQPNPKPNETAKSRSCASLHNKQKEEEEEEKIDSDDDGDMIICDRDNSDHSESVGKLIYSMEDGEDDSSEDDENVDTPASIDTISSVDSGNHLTTAMAAQMTTFSSLSATILPVIEDKKSNTKNNEHSTFYREQEKIGIVSPTQTNTFKYQSVTTNRRKRSNSNSSN